MHLSHIQVCRDFFQILWNCFKMKYSPLVSLGQWWSLCGSKNGTTTAASLQMIRFQGVFMAAVSMLEMSTSCCTCSSAYPCPLSPPVTSVPPHVCPCSGLLSLKYCDTISLLWCKYVLKVMMLTKKTDGWHTKESLHCW